MFFLWTSKSEIRIMDEMEGMEEKGKRMMCLGG